MPISDYWVAIQKGEEEDAIRDILKIEVGAHGQDVLKLVRFKHSEKDVWSVAYRAEEIVRACVVLTDWDGEYFNMKVMTEDAGPFVVGVPLDVIELLTATKNEEANEWRASCRAYAHRISDEPSRFEEFVNNDFSVSDDGETTHAGKEYSPSLKPFVIKLTGDILSGAELRFDGLAVAEDTREAMRFDTSGEAEQYIADNETEIRRAGGDPAMACAVFTLPTGYTHQ